MPDGVRDLPVSQSVSSLLVQCFCHGTLMTPFKNPIEMTEQSVKNSHAEGCSLSGRLRVSWILGFNLTFN